MTGVSYVGAALCVRLPACRRSPFLLQPHPPISISHACSCAGCLCVRACVRLPVGHPQHQQHKRVGAACLGNLSTDRKEESHFKKVVCFFSSLFWHIVVGVYVECFPFSRGWWPCHCIPPLIPHWPAQIFCSILRRCVCVCAVNGLGLAIWSDLKCANANVNRPNCNSLFFLNPKIILTD